MHGKGGDKKDKSSENSDKEEKTNVRTTQNNIMNKADEILGGGNQPPRTPISGTGGNNGGNSGGNSGARFMGKIASMPAIKGATSLVGKYFWPATKALGSGALRTLSTASGAMLGFAGGVAKGDISAALKGAATGGAMGNGLAKGGINIASNLSGKIQSLGNDIQDTYNEGAYGTEYAKDVKMVREFKQTSDYKDLKEKYKDQLTDEKLIEILKAANEKAKK